MIKEDVMKKVVVLLSVVVMFVVLAAVTGVSLAAEKKDVAFINIGTAGIGGSAYPTGGYICSILNTGRNKYGHNIRCSVESTGGSIANLRSLKSGDMSAGIVMASYANQSYNGTGMFEKEGTNKKLRYVFASVEEPVHIVTRKDANIKSFRDLKGKIVNTGEVGSGTQATIYGMMKRYGVSPKEFFKQETTLSLGEQASALCDGKIQAFFWVTTIGAGTIMEVTNTCAVNLVSWDDDVVTKMLAETPEATKMIIPANTYRGQEKEVVSWGTPGLVLASSDVPEDIIYYLVKGVFDDIETFKKQSPMYKNMTAKWAISAGKTIPYHPGAERYFREVGLVK
jgi:TRAP transporter TAXI family solute receptor